MDVIALAQYGFKHAVAPLGTAITEGQLTLMWRMHPEPIIALDGDTAGLRAALRLIDLALPLLEAGKSLRFCIMPEGQDPDDVLKARGASAMQELLDGAIPMVNLLWQREIEGKIFDSPERRAALDTSLRSAITKIQDKSIRHHYGQAIKELRYQLFTPQRTQQQRTFIPWAKQAKQLATIDAKASILAATTDSGMRLRESVILAAAIRNPTAALKNETKMEKCPITTPALKEIMNALLANLHHDLTKADTHTTFDDILAQQLGYSPLDRLLELKPLSNHPYLGKTVNAELTKRTLEEELAKHSALIGAASEIKEAEQDLTGLVDEGLTWRLKEAAQTRNRATRAVEEEATASDEDTSEMSKNLQNMLDNKIWVKKKP